MLIDRRTLLGSAVGASLAGAAKAQHFGVPPHVPQPAPWPPTVHFKLWPGVAPGVPATLPRNDFASTGGRAELTLRGITDPVVAIYRPEKPDGRAILAIPGGGYGYVSMENEGINVATALNPHGVTVFALAYRLPGEGWADRWNVPLQDAQRAMRLIRARASSWGVDPARVGVLGFSAGGHLAASLTVGHRDRVYKPVDAADDQSARPSWSGLIYPVINFTGAGAHAGSADNLLGPRPPAAARAAYHTDARVTADTPPMFLVHAMDDTVVGVDQSLAMIAAARAARVPVEAHLLEKGGHGFGALHLPPDAPGRLWTDIFARWTMRH